MPSIRCCTYCLAAALFLLLLIIRGPQNATPRAGTGAGARAEQSLRHPPAKLFSFGLLADVQHTDVLEEGSSFEGVPRYYQQALQVLGRAVTHFQAAQVDFAVHLGDLVDVHATGVPADPKAPERALQAVLSHFRRLQRPVLHTLGNHCLYSFTRQQLNSRLGIAGYNASLPHSYYTFRPPGHHGWRLLVLDGYELSVLGWPKDHPLHQQAAKVLAERNPNQNQNSPDGLKGVDRRFVKFGGGLGQEQLAWLERQLEEARSSGERVIVLSHLCIHPRACLDDCLLWDYKRVLQVLQRYGGGVVAATLSGHAHVDKYHLDETGIHHRVCKAVLETPPGRDCFGVVDVYPDRLVVRGVDTFAGGEWVVGGGSRTLVP